MIGNETAYRRFLATQGVGAKDRVASSIDSYVSYLRTVSRLTSAEVTPVTLRCEDDVLDFVARLDGKAALKTIRNCRSAMRHYVAFVQTLATP